MHPVLFEAVILGAPVRVHAYGFLLGLAFVAGLGIALWRARAEGFSLERTATVAVVALFSSVVGARLAQLLMAERERFLADPTVFFDAEHRAYAFLGGVLLAFPLTLLGAHLLRLRAMQVADAFIVAVAFGLLPTRLGCFLAGCCQGQRASEWGWPETLAVTFPGSRDALIPTQLLEALGGLCIFLALVLVALPHRRAFGELLAWFFVLYAPLRFTLELLRSDLRGTVGALTSAQALLVVPFALSLWFLLRVRAARPAQLDDDGSPSARH